MILLDTQSLVWLAGAPRRLSRRAASAIRRAPSAGGLAIASVTLWELAQIAARGWVRIHEAPESWVRRLVEQTGVAVKEITIEIAVTAARLPLDFPRDPMDRLIAATARIEGIPLVTADEHIRASPLIETIW